MLTFTLAHVDNKATRAGVVRCALQYSLLIVVQLWMSGVLPMSLAPVFATAFGRGYQLASLPQYYTYAGISCTTFLLFSDSVLKCCINVIVAVDGYHCDYWINFVYLHCFIVGSIQSVRNTVRASTETEALLDWLTF